MNIVFPGYFPADETHDGDIVYIDFYEYLE